MRRHRPGSYEQGYADAQLHAQEGEDEPITREYINSLTPQQYMRRKAEIDTWVVEYSAQKQQGGGEENEPA